MSKLLEVPCRYRVLLLFIGLRNFTVNITYNLCIYTDFKYYRQLNKNI